MGDKRNREEEDSQETVDGFTWEELKHMLFDGVAEARCTECRESAQVEPDAEDYDYQACGAKGSVTSPLRKLGLI